MDRQILTRTTYDDPNTVWVWTEIGAHENDGDTAFRTRAAAILDAEDAYDTVKWAEDTSRNGSLRGLTEYGSEITVWPFILPPLRLRRNQAMWITAFDVSPISHALEGVTQDPATVGFAPVFPLDMLRYDSCFPATSESVSLIANFSLFSAGAREAKVRLAKFHHSKNSAYIRVDRWASFGWRVDLNSVKTQKAV